MFSIFSKSNQSSSRKPIDTTRLMTPAGYLLIGVEPEGIKPDGTGNASPGHTWAHLHKSNHPGGAHISYYPNSYTAAFASAVVAGAVTSSAINCGDRASIVKDARNAETIYIKPLTIEEVRKIELAHQEVDDGAENGLFGYSIFGQTPLTEATELARTSYNSAILSVENAKEMDGGVHPTEDPFLGVEIVPNEAHKIAPSRNTLNCAGAVFRLLSSAYPAEVAAMERPVRPSSVAELAEGLSFTEISKERAVPYLGINQKELEKGLESIFDQIDDGPGF